MTELVWSLSNTKYVKTSQVFTPRSANGSSDSDCYSFAVTISYSPTCLHVQLLKIILVLWLLLPSGESHPCIALLCQLFPLRTDKPHGKKIIQGKMFLCSFNISCSYAVDGLCQMISDGTSVIGVINLVEILHHSKWQYSTVTKAPVWLQFSIFCKLICLKNKLPFKTFWVKGKTQY